MFADMEERSIDVNIVAVFVSTIMENRSINVQLVAVLVSANMDDNRNKHMWKQVVAVLLANMNDWINNAPNKKVQLME